MSSEASSAAPAAASTSAEDAAFNDPSADEKVPDNRVRIKKWSAVAFWSYDIENDTCAICHNQLMVPCFTPDHQILTSQGWLFVDELRPLLQPGSIPPEFQFATYDNHRECLEYQTATGGLIEKRVNAVMEFSDAAERARWADLSSKDSSSSVSGSQVSIVVTEDHLMWARKGEINADGSAVFGEQPFTLTPARNLAVSASECFQFQSRAVNGLCRSSPAAPLPFTSALKLDSDAKTAAFLSLYGFWLGNSGSMNACSGSLTLRCSPLVHERHYLASILNQLNQVENIDYSIEKSPSNANQWLYHLQNPSLLECLNGLDTSNYGSFTWQLEKDSARSLINGLQYAESNPDSNVLHTNNALFRDSTIRLLLHAGYSAHFYRDSASQAWAVSYSEAEELSRPQLKHDDVHAIPYNGSVWCVTVPPHHTVIVRRAHRDSAGEVVQASRPLVCGQCISCEAEPTQLTDCTVAWGQCGHSFHFHCAAAGTLVNLDIGLSKPIESVAAGAQVFGYQKETAGLIATPVKRLLNQGTKECIELTLEDGRTIVCTPDHEILTTAGWVEAGKLKLGSSHVVCGPQYPELAVDANSSWSLRFDSSTTFRCNSADEVIRSSIFFRILGLLLTNGCIPTSDSQSATVFLGHQSDAETFQREFEIAFGDSSLSPIRTKSGWAIQLPLEWTRSLIALEPIACARGARVDRDFALPDCVLSSNLPKFLLREFLAAAIGADGLSPVFSSQDDITAGEFIQSKSVDRKDNMRAGMQQFCDLLNQFNCDATLMGEPCIAKEDPLIATQRLQIRNVVAFTEQIGIRYCSLKQIQFAAATAVFRYKQSDSVNKMGISEWSKSTGVDRLLRAAEDAESEVEIQSITEAERAGSDADENEFELEEADQANHENRKSSLSISSSAPVAPALPTFHLPVAQIRRMGPRPTFDLEVDEGIHSFVAGGLVIHNCISRWLKTRSTCPLDDQEWDFVQY